MELRDRAAFDRSQIDILFDDAGMPPPVIRFDPSAIALPNEQFRTFARLCDRLSPAAGAAIPRDAIRLETFGNMSDYMRVAERSGPGAAQWRFTYVGPEIQARQGPGNPVTDLSDLTPAVAALFVDIWTQAAALGGKRVFTRHPPGTGTFLSAWNNFWVPITSAGPGLTRLVDGFVSYCQPEDTLSPGLDACPEPVCIVDGENRVRFANRAAREVFDGGDSKNAFDCDLTEFTESDLVLFGQPAAARRAARRLRQPCRCLINGRIVVMDAVVSTIHHNGDDYFIVAFRQIH